MPEIKCNICGSRDNTEAWASDAGERMKDRELCFSCNSWDEVAERAKINPHTSVCFNGTHYFILPEDATGMRGYGGRAFVVVFKDGTVVRTTNLWLTGEVPQYFIATIPSNAEVFSAARYDETHPVKKTRKRASKKDVK